MYTKKGNMRFFIKLCSFHISTHMTVVLSMLVVVLLCIGKLEFHHQTSLEYDYSQYKPLITKTVISVL